MLRARWLAFWHQLFGMFGSHRIWRVTRKPAGSLFYRLERIYCSCGREFK